MKIYKVHMDLLQAMPLLKKFNLGEYSIAFPIIFIEADDPDQACHLAYYRLVENILKQDASQETSNLIHDISFDIRVIKVYVP